MTEKRGNLFTKVRKPMSSKSILQRTCDNRLAVSGCDL